MRTSETMTLPVALQHYDTFNEQTARRTSEQFLQDLRADLVEVRDNTDKSASMAKRRHQFLLMGA